MDTQPPRRLFLVTLCILLLTAIITPILYHEALPSSIQINTVGQPTLGYSQAPVHLVVFEEPKCPECKQFSLEVFPKIKENYIDTNKIKYTLITVSFLPNSLPAAVALLSVYHSDPQFPNDELYFAYFHHIYQHQPPETIDWATTDTLMRMASATSPAININQLKHSILTQKYRIEVEKNTLYAQEIMGGRIITPTVYVNGIKADSLSYGSIKTLIDHVLKRNGG